MTLLRWLLLVISVVVYRVWFPEPPLPPPMRLDYDLVVIAAVALYRGGGIGTIAGWGIGFLAAATDPDRMAWGGLLGACLGWTVGAGKERLFLEYAVSRWMVFWGVLVLYKFVDLVVMTRGDGGLLLASLFSGVLASSGLTATVGAVATIIWERTRPPHRITAAMAVDDSN
ncbi:MAG: hypothetical protein HY304_09275 [candidate division Zixibacteria bacterium]|nr:hypothetical protein [candidate division Zixibacteria bacterium]